MAETTHFLNGKDSSYLSVCGINLGAKYGRNSSAYPCDGWTFEWREVDCPDCLAIGAEKALMPIPFQMSRQFGESDDAFRRRCKTIASLAQDLLDSPGHVDIEVVGEKDVASLEDLLADMRKKGLVDG